jgi:S1-C subfamily serine protease
LTPWLFLFLAPVAGMALLLSHSGSAWLDRGAIRPEGAAILPGLTVEAAPSPRAQPSAPSHLVVTSVRSGSPATQRGIAVGDTVVAIDGARIFSLDQARRSLQKNRAATVALRVVHGRQVRDVRLMRPDHDRVGGRRGPQAARRRG